MKEGAALLFLVIFGIPFAILLIAACIAWGWWLLPVVGVGVVFLMGALGS